MRESSAAFRHAVDRDLGRILIARYISSSCSIFNPDFNKMFSLESVQNIRAGGVQWTAFTEHRSQLNASQRIRYAGSGIGFSVVIDITGQWLMSKTKTIWLGKTGGHNRWRFAYSLAIRSSWLRGCLQCTYFVGRGTRIYGAPTRLVLIKAMQTAIMS